MTERFSSGKAFVRVAVQQALQQVFGLWGHLAQLGGAKVDAFSENRLPDLLQRCSRARFPKRETCLRTQML